MSEQLRRNISTRNILEEFYYGPLFRREPYTALHHRAEEYLAASSEPLVALPAL